MKKTILINIILIIIIVLILGGRPDPDGHYESVCIKADSSAKETVILNHVLHDGRVFPVESEQKTGCLILHDYYMVDVDGDGTKDMYHPFAEFGNDDMDHCCIDGD